MKTVRTSVSVLLVLCCWRTLSAGSWETSWTYNGISYISVGGHDNAGFVVHKAGDESKHFIYSFYLIADPHIGDVNDFPDYNEYGWLLPLNLDRNPDRMGGKNGSFPGRHLNYAINLINDYYNYGEGDGWFCVVLGDLSNTAEVAELQHAKKKLDSLDYPWALTTRNHDTALDKKKIKSIIAV